jgi:hypothetical protein
VVTEAVCEAIYSAVAASMLTAILLHAARRDRTKVGQLVRRLQNLDNQVHLEEAAA